MHSPEGERGCPPKGIDRILCVHKFQQGRARNAEGMENAPWEERPAVVFVHGGSCRTSHGFGAPARGDGRGREQLDLS